MKMIKKRKLANTFEYNKEREENMETMRRRRQIYENESSANIVFLDNNKEMSSKQNVVSGIHNCHMIVHFLRATYQKLYNFPYQ